MKQTREEENTKVESHQTTPIHCTLVEDVHLKKVIIKLPQNSVRIKNAQQASHSIFLKKR